MKIKRIIVAAVGAAILTSSLVSCSGSSPEASENGTIIQNSETVQGLSYRASGSTGDGADDARITVKATKTDPEATEAYDTLVPWTRTSTGNDGDTVSMTVESLSTDGKAECQIFYKDIIIRNVATGDHAIAKCEGVLSAFGK